MHFLGAQKWMWTYCIYLGEFTSEDGTKYDLGVYEASEFDVSYAIVHNSRRGDYAAGALGFNPAYESGQDHYRETQIRWEKYKEKREADKCSGKINTK